MPAALPIAGTFNAMRPRLALIVLVPLLALAAPGVARAAQTTPAAAAQGEAKALETGLKTEPEPPASTPAAAAAEEPSEAVETEDEERLSSEAEALMVAEEAAVLHRTERETAASEDEPLGSGSAPANTQCLVPSLKGDMLRAARRALSKAHCKLGRVTEPRALRAKLIVTGQSRPVGARLTDKAPVAVRLGAARRR